MFRLGVRMFLLVVSMVVAAPTIQATSFVYNSATEIVDHSEAILVGTVLSSTELYEGATPWTYYEIAVDRVIKGDVEDSILTLRFYGAENFGYFAGTPRLLVQERYLLFIAGNGPRAVPLVNWDSGIYRFRQRPDTGETVLASLDGHALSGIVNGEWQVSTVNLPTDPIPTERGSDAEPPISEHPEKVPNADRVLSIIQKFVAQRKGKSSFEPGETIQSVPLPSQSHTNGQSNSGQEK